jgi:hypothetical protein
MRFRARPRRLKVGRSLLRWDNHSVQPGKQTIEAKKDCKASAVHRLGDPELLSSLGVDMPVESLPKEGIVTRNGGRVTLRTFRTEAKAKWQSATLAA